MSQFIEVIEWFDETGNQMVYRFPPEGSGEIKIGAQLIVREFQKAIFFRDGKAHDIFDSGRHTLTTMNIPILTKALSLPFGFDSPFKAEVIFIGTKTFIDLKWGTQSPIVFRDSELAMVRLRAFGVYSIRIADPLLFVKTITATQGIYTTDSLASFLKEIIVSRLNDLLGEKIKTVLELPQYYDEFGAAIKSRVKGDFEKIGIELVNIFINSITPPDEVQKMIDERASMGAIGNMDKYMQYKAAIAMEKMADNKGGDGGGSSASAGMGLGLGAGFGMMMPGMLNKAMNQASPEAQPGQDFSGKCTSCGYLVSVPVKFCGNCGKEFHQDSKEKFCTDCGKSSPENSKFCGDCGTHLK